MQEAFDRLAAVAEDRGRVYGLLAVGFHEPGPDLATALGNGSYVSDLREALGWLGRDAEPFEPLLRDLAGVAADTGPDHVGCQEGAGSALQDLKVEYTRLFVGPGPAVAAPYESVYLDGTAKGQPGTVMGESTLAVQREYDREGLQLSPDHRDLPDHVAVELEFLYYLCNAEAEAWRRGDPDEARRLRNRQREFLGRHLSRWLPELADRVARGSRHPFYRTLAALCLHYVRIDQGEGFDPASLPIAGKWNHGAR